ncbi:MAG: four helix bundle protein [Candidatus Kerfeldbacteria bacterium]
MIHSYKELTVWQRAMELVSEIYALTGQFPKEEVYGLCSQLRRAAVAIPSNIAEGRYRGTKKNYSQFLRITYGSGAE